VIATNARPGDTPSSAGHPFILEDLRPEWRPPKVTCQDVLVIGELLVKCELVLEGRHASDRPGEHHGHLEMPGKIWVTVTWRANGR
jgi:hypothetical protein